MNNDESYEYNEDLILDASEEVLLLRKKNSTGTKDEVFSLSEKLISLLKNDVFIDRKKNKDDVKENLEYFAKFDLEDEVNLSDLKRQNDEVMDFIVSEVVDENYTLCNLLIEKFEERV